LISLGTLPMSAIVIRQVPNQARHAHTRAAPPIQWLGSTRSSTRGAVGRVDEIRVSGGSPSPIAPSLGSSDSTNAPLSCDMQPQTRRTTEFSSGAGCKGRALRNAVLPAPSAATVRSAWLKAAST
jgi:hypothetical protein